MKPTYRQATWRARIAALAHALPGSRRRERWRIISGLAQQSAASPGPSDKDSTKRNPGR
ncbi:MAG: hypothetical protein K9L70_01015 [Thiohalocapsa sp.]|jgi:hypothetical protein|nr:hypothetical protein [Thiohalocapsa sp.]MCF7991796.1 hypothetical protein [Thiohalocapsa sp.]